MKTNIRKQGKAVKIITILVAIIIVLGCYGLLAWFNNWFPFVMHNGTHDPGTQFVAMDKTDTEKQAADNLKKNPQDKLKNTQADTPDIPSVDPGTGMLQADLLITNAGIFNDTVSVSGFVTNIVESDGSCTYTFTQGSKKVQKVVATLPNATSTTCITTSFPASELQTGTWSVVLSYKSTQSLGVSAAKEFNK